MISVSIIIITYGRVQEFLDTLNCIKSYNKSNIELLILDNNEMNYLKEKVENVLNNIKFTYQYYSDGTNYGVAEGRNFLINRANGKYIVTLDDDINLENINDLIDKVLNYFANYNDVGCLAFSIINYYSRKKVSYEIPHGNKKLNFENNMHTYYFIGAGHAIRNSIYKEVGLYPTNLGVYGGEELDLSFRIIENNSKILYTSDIVVYHKISSNGRMDLSKQFYMKYRNRIFVIYKYMPYRYFLTNLLIWSLYYFIKQKKILNVIKTIKSLKGIKPSRIKKSSFMYLKEVKARLLY